MRKPIVYLPWGNIKVHSLRKATPIQIICGDCSSRVDEDGNTELLPIRTFLAKDGRCYTCGSASFVFASDLCRVLRHTISERRTDSEIELSLKQRDTRDLALMPESNADSLSCDSQSYADASSCIN